MRRIVGGCFGWGMMAVLFVSCRTAPSLPPVDLSQPGWHVRQGQAIWKPTASRPELSGELMLATNSDGDLFVQFSKSPFPMATAQIFGERWRIEFGAGNYTGGGIGKPSARFGWFQLEAALAGGTLGSGWHFEGNPAANWKLWNPRTGESLEGYLGP